MTNAFYAKLQYIRTFHSLDQGFLDFFETRLPFIMQTKLKPYHIKKNIYNSTEPNNNNKILSIRWMVADNTLQNDFTVKFVPVFVFTPKEERPLLHM